ncbi:Crp/Fnr family transcriptional regulator [Sphingobacterium sp.]|uniref:Crp/Fnr family transcriptional regulator n=1 Tax=Sphingobacterium sp. TaxID=341027 RepID=UPI0028A29EFF|nr:Crp/Fnr family transcriptional regulator [Sphingobacterium sp.]
MHDLFIAFLQKHQLLSPSDKSLIAQYFEYASISEGERLFEGGKVCNELFFIAAGVVRICSNNDKGIEVTHYFYRENQLCTLFESFERSTIGLSNIEACCDTEILKISKAKLLELYEKIPALKATIDQVIKVVLLEKIRIKNSYLGQEGLDKYKIFVEQQPEVVSRISVKVMASFLGLTRQSLSRIRRQVFSSKYNASS